MDSLISISSQSFLEYINSSNIVPIAHRGASLIAAENSFESFRKAFDLGYRVIETDIHSSKDGTAYIFHDNTLERLTGENLKISDLKEKYNGQVLRLALISAHYSQPLDWNEKLMDECEKTLNKWYDCYVPVYKKTLIQDNDLKPLYDDLNTPGFIAVLHRLFDKAKDNNKKDKELFTTACNFIGLLNQSKEEWYSFKKKNLKLSEKDILSKINQRNKARLIKNYELADKIRNELLDKGILIEDEDGKTTWKIK
mgnify:CR=1 FL=1